MDPSLLRPVYRGHHEPLWRSIVAASGGRSQADAVLVEAVSDLLQGQAVGNGPAVNGVTEHDGGGRDGSVDRAALWAAAFDRLESRSGWRPESLTTPAGSTVHRPADPAADDDSTSVVMAPDLLDVADAVAAATPEEARLLLGHHVGGLDAAELARLVGHPAEVTVERLRQAEERFADLAVESPKRWADRLAGVPVPDLEVAAGLAPDGGRWRLPALVGVAAVLAAVVAVGAGRGGAGLDVERALAPALDPSSPCRAASVAEIVDLDPSAGSGATGSPARDSFDDLVFRTDVLASARISAVVAEGTALRYRFDQIVMVDSLPRSSVAVPTNLTLPINGTARGWDGSIEVGEEALLFLSRSNDGWRAVGGGGVLVSCGSDGSSALLGGWGDGAAWPQDRSRSALIEQAARIRAERAVLELLPIEVGLEAGTADGWVVGSGAVEGGTVLPDGRRLWVRLPDQAPADRLSVRIVPTDTDTDSDTDTRIELRGPGVAIGVRPGGCTGDAPSAANATGSVASLAAGALTVCLDGFGTNGTGTAGALAVDVDSVGMSRPEVLAEIDVLVAAPASSASSDAATYVHDPGRGRVVGLDPISFQPRWSFLGTDRASVVAVAGLQVFVADGDTELVALDRSDGAARWRTDATAIRYAAADPLGNVLYLVEGDGGPAPLGPVLALRDTATGMRRWEVPIPAGVSRSIVGVGSDAIVLDRGVPIAGGPRGAEGPAWSLFAIGDTDGEPTERWRVDAAAPRGGSDREAQALIDSSKGVVLVLTPDRLARFDAVDGRLRWEVPVSSNRELRLDAIWVNTATLTVGDRTLTISLTDGTFLPP